MQSLPAGNGLSRTSIKFRLHNISVEVEYILGEKSPITPPNAEKLTREVSEALERHVRTL